MALATAQVSSACKAANSAWERTEGPELTMTSRNSRQLGQLWFHLLAGTDLRPATDHHQVSFFHAVHGFVFVGHLNPQLHFACLELVIGVDDIYHWIFRIADRLGGNRQRVG